jgi:hypothetical protein
LGEASSPRAALCVLIKYRAVVTSPWSDWTIAPAAHSTSTLGDSPYALYMQIVRQGPLLAVSQHLSPHGVGPGPPAADLVKIREVRAFNVDVHGSAQAKEGDKWRVGVMVCGPNNSNGTLAEFENFTFEYI